MNEIVVAGMRQREINFWPKNKLEEIEQNIRMILTAPKYSVPLDRAFGINIALLDEPQEAVLAGLTAEIFDAIQRYEPRAKVTKVEYTADADGKIYPKVKVRLNGV